MPDITRKPSARVAVWAAHRLSPLIAEYRSDGDWPVMDVDLVTLLVDVLGALGLSVGRAEHMLGPAATHYHRSRASQRWRLTSDD